MLKAIDWDHQIGRRLRLRDLQVFFTVSQCGSMAKAATQLAVSTPSVSEVVANLEHAIGVRLLDRNPRGVEPTKYGNALLKRILVVFDELKQGIKDIEYLSDPGAGELCIGGGVPHAHGIILAIIDRLSQQYPRSALQVVIAGTLELHDALRERRIELAFTRMAQSAPPEDMDQDVLFEDPHVVVVGAQNPWARRRKVKLAELVNEPWTWPSPGSLVDSIVVDAFRANGLKPIRAAIYVDDPNLRIKLAATGRLLAIVPASTHRFHEKRASIKVLPVDLLTPHRQTGIITLKNRTLSPLAQRFVEAAREVAKPLAKRKA